MRGLSRKRCVTCWRNDMLYPHRTTDRSALDTAYNTTDGSTNNAAIKTANKSAFHATYDAALHATY